MKCVDTTNQDVHLLENLDGLWGWKPFLNGDDNCFRVQQWEKRRVSRYFRFPYIRWPHADEPREIGLFDDIVVD